MAEARQVLNQINMQHVLNELNRDNFEPGTKHLVDVTHIHDPRHFYVRPASLSKQVEILEEPGEQIPAELVDRQTYVVYKSTILNKFARGEVRSVTMNPDTHCVIYAIDYGCIDTMVALRDIYYPRNSVDCPPMAIRCQMHFCYPISGRQFDDNAVETMKCLIGHEPAKMTVQCKMYELLLVELRTASYPDDTLTMMLAHMGCAQISNMNHTGW